MTAMSDARLLSADVAAVPLHDEKGALRATERGLGSVGGLEVGLWEAGPGRDDDTEVDEAFLVLSGAGRLSFEDGSEIELRPGVLVRLHAGDRTTWEVSERLRKFYLA